MHHGTEVFRFFTVTFYSCGDKSLRCRKITAAQRGEIGVVPPILWEVTRKPGKIRARQKAPHRRFVHLHGNRVRVQSG